MGDSVEPTLSRIELAPARRVSTAFTPDEKRRVFKSMVVAELEVGFLRYSKRQSLLRYAASMGISEFDAMLLMAEAQHHAGEIEPIHFESAATLTSVSRPDAWPASMRLSFALVVAIFLDLALIFWIFR